MNDLDFVALLPRAPGMSLEQMIVELWVARTGHPPTEAEWELIQPKLEELHKVKRPFALRPGKFRG